MLEGKSSPKVLDRAEEILLEAVNSPHKRIVLHGGTVTADADLEALNLAASAYCQERGWSRAGTSEFVFILTQAGIEYATQLKRSSRERAVERATWMILEEAEKNNWELHWIEHDHGNIVQVNNRPLAETEEEQQFFSEACYRMVNENGYLVRVSGVLYRVTEKGRKALYGRMQSVPVPTKSESLSAGGVIMAIDPKQVFVVHGRDDKVREEVELFLHRIGLDPIVLFREVSGGKVVIEKFEHHAGKVGYAVVILNPEDVGYLKPECNGGNKGADEDRARQNVVFEMGYFFALLGRGKVAALQRGKVTKPSDIDGIVYIPMEDGKMDWKITLAKEMVAAGLAVNMSKI